MHMRHSLFSRFKVANLTLQAIGRLLAVTHQNNSQQALVNLGQEFINHVLQLRFRARPKSVFKATGAQKKVTFGFAEAKGDEGSSRRDLRSFCREQEVVQAAIDWVTTLYWAKRLRMKGNRHHNKEAHSQSEGYTLEELSNLYQNLKGILGAYLQKMEERPVNAAQVDSPLSGVSGSSSEESLSDGSSPKVANATVAQQSAFKSPSPFKA